MSAVGAGTYLPYLVDFTRQYFSLIIGYVDLAIFYNIKCIWVNFEANTHLLNRKLNLLGLYERISFCKDLNISLQY